MPVTLPSPRRRASAEHRPHPGPPCAGCLQIGAGVAAPPDPASPALAPPALAPPLAIAPERCNRCGACLRLACPAIEDAGGESLAIDAGVCTGCGRCAPLCRGRAIGALSRRSG